MNEENKIGYYAVIPSTILFNEDLKANEKLLYAVITILANKEGYYTKKNLSKWYTLYCKNDIPLFDKKDREYVSNRTI